MAKRHQSLSRHSSSPSRSRPSPRRLVSEDTGDNASCSRGGLMSGTRVGLSRYSLERPAALLVVRTNFGIRSISRGRGSTCGSTCDSNPSSSNGPSPSSSASSSPSRNPFVRLRTRLGGCNGGGSSSPIGCEGDSIWRQRPILGGRVRA